MKKLLVNILLVDLLFMGCNANNNAGTSTPASNGDKAAVTEKTPAVENSQAGDLVGAWQLKMMITDDNRNNKIDEDERKKAMTQAQDYLKLNADGTCEFYTFKVKGRYELKPESDGKKLLVLFDKDNNRESRGTIESVTRDELVLLKHSSGGVFSVYRRL